MKLQRKTLLIYPLFVILKKSVINVKKGKIIKKETKYLKNLNKTKRYFKIKKNNLINLNY